MRSTILFTSPYLTLLKQVFFKNWLSGWQPGNLGLASRVEMKEILVRTDVTQAEAK
jgi:hypothetical protein